MVYVKGVKNEVLNLSETGTKYGERTVSSIRSTEGIQMIFERS